MCATGALKAIETRYNGYRFRSRLEARWAVYFDAIGIEYWYEPEGYDLGELGWYLPDFWLPQVNMWAEVKPQELAHDEYTRCAELAKQTGFPCLMLIGPPEAKSYFAIEYGEYDKVGNTHTVDYVISKGPFHRNYYRDEHRFYAQPSEYEIQGGCFEDIQAGISAARSARFKEGYAVVTLPLETAREMKKRMRFER